MPFVNPQFGNLHFVNRDYRRTERDDFELNVRQLLSSGYGAVKQYAEDGTVVGWVIKPIYE